MGKDFNGHDGKKLNIPELIANARKQIDEEPHISAGLKTTLELVLTVCLLLADKLVTKNSKNSNLPPAMDLNRKRNSKAEGKQKPGGQPGHEGKTLQPVDNPDKIVKVKVDRKSLPPGKWKKSGYERRQIFDFVIKRQVTEYRAERLVNDWDEYITAEFPDGLVQAAQYGNGVKALGVYLSVEQLIPYDRAAEYFESQVGFPLSAGTICNFKKEAYDLLGPFEGWVKGSWRGLGYFIAMRRG
jgi:transposase